MFFFPCPSCTYRMQSTADRVGQRVLCPKCYQAVSVPDPDAPTDPPEDTVPVFREPDLRPAAGTRHLAPVRPHVAPPPDPSGGVVLFQPSQAAAADAMTQLTSAITTRMKPPPEVPTPDLRLSTAVWVALTAAGLVFWCATVIYQGGPLHYVKALAVIQLTIGIGWMAYVDGRRHWVRGFLTLIPPVAIYRLVRGHGPDHNRPLRFVLSGLLLLALVFANEPARQVVRKAFGMDAHKTLPSAIPDSHAARIASLTGRADRSPLLAELKKISDPAIVASVYPGERVAMAVELRKVVAMDDRPEVTAAALEALIVWVGDMAKPDVAAVLQSTSQATRQLAVPIMVSWKDTEAALALVPLLRKRDERRDVAEALVKIGAPAEGPVLDLLPGLTDQMTGVAALNVLAEIGTEKSVKYLLAYADSADDLLLREIARRKAQEIKDRLEKGAKSPGS
jgi:hypothetical protein